MKNKIPIIKILNENEIRENINDYFSLLNHKPKIARWLLEENILHDSKLDLVAIVAFQENQMIGNITLFHFNRIGLVGNVFLEESNRGKGIGSQMMKCLEDYARLNKHSHHVLWVDPIKRPAAFNLYKKFGYLHKENTGIMINNFYKITTKNSDIVIHNLDWHHYPELNLITSNNQLGLIISLIFKCYINATFEMEFLNYKQDEKITGYAIENIKGDCLGAIFIKKNELWEQQADLAFNNNHFLFDIIIADENINLLIDQKDKIPLPTGKIVAYTEFGSMKERLYKKIFGEPIILDNYLSLKNLSHDISMFVYDSK